MTILEKVLPKELWEGAYSCPECKHRIPKLTKEEYNEKKNALIAIRRRMSEMPYRNFQYTMCSDIDNYIANLTDDGFFADISDSYGDALIAIKRLAFIFEKMRYYGAKNLVVSADVYERLLKAVIKYCKTEVEREDKGPVRFLNSVFTFPTCAANIYMSMLTEMEAVERGEVDNLLITDAAEWLLKASLQAWTLCERGDHTDKHPISLERIRNHKWWESGNALGYRPLFYTAVMFLSVEMMEVVVYASINSFSVTSHNTNSESFWKEGFTADGIGWAHGRQPAFQSYPADGMRYTLFPLQYLRYSPWECELRKINFDIVVNFIRSSTWNQYKGHLAQPLTTRNMFEIEKNDIMPIQYIDIVANLLTHFSDLMTSEQVDELRTLYRERYNLKMNTQPMGKYMGAKYFWNNDILAKRSDTDYFILHMASNRSDGAEFCYTFADGYNYFASDGAYLIMKSGEEYNRSKGAFILCQMPGITARQIDNKKLIPGINWSGFHSLHSFCGGVVNGSNGVAGFIFEKDNKRSIDAAGIEATVANPEIYDVIAYKSYFVFDKVIVCLGAGIKNLNTELDGNIMTSINQTAWCNDILYKTKESIHMIKHQEPVCKTISLDDDIWVMQNGIVYGIYSKYTDGKLVISATRDKTNWHFLNTSNQDGRDADINMFRLLIDHDKAIEENKYAYLMYTGEEDRFFENDTKPKILENNTRLQAVMQGDCIEAIFYDKAAVCDSGRYEISVSEEAVLLAEIFEDKMKITISDPLQREGIKHIFVKIIDKLTGKERIVKVKMPSDVMSGAQVVHMVSLQ